MEIKGNLILELKDYLTHNYKLGRHKDGSLYINDKFANWMDLNSIFIDCKTVLPKTTKSLLFSILNSDFVETISDAENK